MKILIVDDHALLREGIASLLTSQGFSVVGMAGSGEEALEALETLQPNVVLMDIGLPGMSGMQATKLILERHPEVSVVALSGQTERRYVVDCWRREHGAMSPKGRRSRNSRGRSAQSRRAAPL